MSKGTMASVSIVGNIGKDARINPAGNTFVANFSVGTTQNVRQNGQYTDVTTWFSVTFFNKTETYLQGLVKGAKVAVSGEMYLETFTDRNGVTRPMICLNAREVVIVQGSNQPRPQLTPDPTQSPDFGDDDIPF